MRVHDTSSTAFTYFANHGNILFIKSSRVHGTTSLHSLPLQIEKIFSSEISVLCCQQIASGVMESCKAWKTNIQNNFENVCPLTMKANFESCKTDNSFIKQYRGPSGTWYDRSNMEHVNFLRFPTSRVYLDPDMYKIHRINKFQCVPEQIAYSQIWKREKLINICHQ